MCVQQGKACSWHCSFCLPAASWGVSGPVGLGMVPRSACRTETMGSPSCSRQGLKPGWAGHGFIFCSRRPAKRKPWVSRLFPTGLGPQSETLRAKTSSVQRWCLQARPFKSRSMHWSLLAVHTVACLSSCQLRSCLQLALLFLPARAQTVSRRRPTTSTTRNEPSRPYKWSWGLPGPKST
jgi:hypothetical protein